MYDAYIPRIKNILAIMRQERKKGRKKKEQKGG
jgi:hypothetical protein